MQEPIEQARRVPPVIDPPPAIIRVVKAQESSRERGSLAERRATINHESKHQGVSHRTDVKRRIELHPHCIGYIEAFLSKLHADSKS